MPRLDLQAACAMTPLEHAHLPSAVDNLASCGTLDSGMPYRKPLICPGAG